MYTRNNLKSDLKAANNVLNEVDPGFHFEAEGRNGYTGLDLYKGNVCWSCTATGTPRECYNAACRWIVARMS